MKFLQKFFELFDRSKKKSNLHIELTEIFDTVLEDGGIYILPKFGYHFCIREDRSTIKFIYKGVIIGTYPNTKSSVDAICGTLIECMIPYSYAARGMFTMRHGREFIWESPHPFSSGPLLLRYRHNVNGGMYINEPLTASEVADGLFKLLPHLPLINFRYGGKPFIYINPSTKKDK